MRSKIGLKALGLCALVVGVMAISASAAQAASQWMVAGSNLATGAKSANVEGKLVNNDASLLATISGLSVEVLCTSGTLVNVQLQGEETTTTGKVKFAGCEAYKLPGKEALNCHVHSPGTASGTVETLEGHGLLELHTTTGEPVTLVIPNTGKSFATLKFLECALSETVPVLGELALRDSGGKTVAETESEKHTVEELKALTKLFVNSEKVGNEATLDGKAEVFLANAAKFSGLAN